MDKLSVRSYARVTLALDIIRKLPSGFHELNTIKQMIDLHDTLTFSDSDSIEILCDASNFPTGNSNIIWKAISLVKREFGIDYAVRVDVEKKIPIGGGLAGGSSNCAATIEALDKLWALDLNIDKKAELGRMLGMDVPYFFYGGTCFDTEATARIFKLRDISVMDILVINPGYGVSTRKAYENLDHDKIGKTLSAEKMRQAIEQGKEKEEIARLMHNDFEYSVFEAYPKLREIKQELIQRGAIGASLSGSGATVIGLFDDEIKARETAADLAGKYPIALAAKTI